MSLSEIKTPDLGQEEAVDVIEVCVASGDSIEANETVVVLESNKATIEVPAPCSGTVKEIIIKPGEKIHSHDLLMTVATTDSEPSTNPQPTNNATTDHQTTNEDQSANKKTQENTVPNPNQPNNPSNQKVATISPPSENQFVPYAGPAVRRLSRQLGIDLSFIQGSGQRQRIVKEDIYQFVKQKLNTGNQTHTSLNSLPTIDFGKWGPIESVPLTNLQQVAATQLTRSWQHIPHVTQFDQADVTDLEAFRKEQNQELAKDSEKPKLTLLAFIVKAVTHTLTQMPLCKASLDASGTQIIYKNYCHVGIAVDTPQGLLVPVLRNTDQKTVSEIAAEIKQLSVKARKKALLPQDMQGGCFTISSLGGIGGTAFTPIVNWPEVAILGLSKLTQQPQYRYGNWEPRLMLPLSFSYDHRVINGADAARFTNLLSRLLQDMREMLL